MGDSDRLTVCETSCSIERGTFLQANLHESRLETVRVVDVMQSVRDAGPQLPSKNGVGDAPHPSRPHSTGPSPCLHLSTPAIGDVGGWGTRRGP